MHIDLRQLRHFVALAEHRSFVAAAQAVCLSQSAFSRSIQALEHQTGFALVDRATRDLAPTKEGLVLLEHARRLVQQAGELSGEIERLNGEEFGQLIFGCGPAPAARLIPQAVAAFIGAHPRARVQFQVDHWEALDRRLRAEEIEFFVADTRRFEADPDYQVSRLQAQRWSFYCRQGHPLAAREQVTCEELFSYPLAATSRPPNLRKVMTDYSGRRDFLPSVECEHSYALLEVVLHSDAIGIGSALNLAPYAQTGQLHTLQVRDLPAHLEERHTRYGIVSRVGRSLSALARTMIAQVEGVDADLTASLAGLPANRFGV